MRYHHVIFVVNRDGKMVQSWPQHDQLFDQPKAPLGPRGPHKIKMSPYDPEKHVWVIDDNLHQIFKFTYDGKLVMTLGQMGVEGRGPNTFARPTDIAWLPDGTFFISDGYHGKRVAKFDKDGKFIMDWGSEPADPKNPGPERVEHRPQHLDQQGSQALSSPIAATSGSRSSTRTASSSTCSRPANRTGQPACGRSPTTT